MQVERQELDIVDSTEGESSDDGSFGRSSHSAAALWESMRSNFRTWLFYIHMCRTRWLWFITSTNLVGLAVVLFIAVVFKQAISHEVLPRDGLIRYEMSLSAVDVMDSRLERFEKQQLELQHMYYEKLLEMERVMRSIINVQSEVHDAIFELRNEIESFKSTQQEMTNAYTKVSSDFQSEVAKKLFTLETQLQSRLVDLESRLSATSDRILAVTNTCSTQPPIMQSEELFLAKKRKRHAVNLASRSHGAFVVSHLTSKAVASGSVVYNLVGTVFGLETYNFAITERTHIMPSEAFCFEGSEGKLTIRLWSNATIEVVEYEHDYWHDVVPISAPKRYDVMACLDRECEEVALLGECQYPNDEKYGPAQMCEMQPRSNPTDQVQIVFRSNHGQEYTCVYQLRVLNWKQ